MAKKKRKETDHFHFTFEKGTQVGELAHIERHRERERESEIGCRYTLSYDAPTDVITLFVDGELVWVRAAGSSGVHINFIYFGPLGTRQSAPYFSQKESAQRWGTCALFLPPSQQNRTSIFREREREKDADL